MPELPTTTNRPQMTPDLVAYLRSKVREGLSSGRYQASEMNQGLQENYGISLAQLMRTNADDVLRGLSQGITLSHADELRGAVAKLRGGSYTAARDAVRQQEQAYVEAGHGAMNMALNAVGGIVPGIVSAPLAGISKGATLMNTLRGGAVGLGTGAIAGEGNSQAQDASGLARDTGFGALVGAGFGLGGGLVGSAIANKGMGTSAERAVQNEVGGMIPEDPSQLHLIIGRQEELAPGTAVIADLPNMQKFVRGIGADQPTAMKAAADAARRIDRIKTALNAVGDHYTPLRDITVPADDQIKAALELVGRRNDVLKGDQVNLGDLHDLRKILLRTARNSKEPQIQFDNRTAAQALTDWMSQPNLAPWIKGVDADYAFLTNRLEAAKQTQKTLLNSHTNYSAQRAAGRNPDELSMGASLPVSRGLTGTVVQKFFKPNPAARARAIAQLLLQPADQTKLGSLVATRTALLHSQSMPLLNLGAQAVGTGGTQGILSTPPQ